jgi:hypothetical protein
MDGKRFSAGGETMTITFDATVIVAIEYFSGRDKCLFLSGFHSTQPVARNVISSQVRAG